MARPLLLLELLCFSMALAGGAALRLELAHVDANEHCTMAERVRRATERTHHRRLQASSTAAGGGVAAPLRWSGKTQYIANYSIGDPPQPAEAIVDTGSDLIWTQCSTCVLPAASGCFPQNLPYYNSSLSRTVRVVPCNGAPCDVAPETGCVRGGDACVVAASYGAGVALGVLGTEAFTFPSSSGTTGTTVTLAFGCVSQTRISPGALNGASGIIGLGRGALSLVNQLNDTKFSYCLTPYFRDTISPSHLFVGEQAGPSAAGGAPVTSVPFAKNPKDNPFSTFYYLPLVGLAVGNATVALPAGTFDLREAAPKVWAGGALIDSGSPFMRLVDPAHRALTKELARQLGDSLVPPPAKLSGALELCVTGGHSLGAAVPPLVLRFDGGGGGSRDLVIPPENFWARVDASTWCMVVVSSARGNATLPTNETTIIGNFMQQDMHVLYDLANGVLSFQPANCSAV
uniref:Peptidase A1 domain-containing protein n=1 Tax=Oryza punctata TaxID=4537 RepID=A0A0E0L1V5_ORYPU